MASRKKPTDWADSGGYKGATGGLGSFGVALTATEYANN